MSYFNQKRLYSPNFSGWTYTSHNYHSHPNRKKKIFFWLLSVFVFFTVVFGFWFTRNVLVGLPDVTSIKNMVFSEATLIEDRNWQILYKLFDENRQYVDYSWISLTIVNAIVALEDQRYWEHNGLDPIGILRAWVNDVIHPRNGLQWASTIPQQLVRNLLLTKDRKITRKLKEIILTSRLGGVLEKQIHQEKWNLTPAELRKDMKTKTLELYLNYIFFGNNAYGVEAASNTYFAKSAKDVTVLEASILASLPKWPSLYDPYKNRKLVMGDFTLKGPSDYSAKVDTGIQKQINDKFASIINSSDFSNKKSNNDVVKFLKWIGSFSISITWGVTLHVQYNNGRKDLALTRMFEDDYITEAQLKEALIQWLDYQFRKNTVQMLAPHFVQRIIEQLEQKYDSGTLFKGWFTIKTTLDLNIQKIAEDALQANNPALQDNGANNSSMLYLDTTNGEVLAYVGSMDYFNETIEWQNDMVRSPRQPWSAMKPFMYSMGLATLPLTLDTPIFDIPFQIWPDHPNDADDRFEGMLPLRKALGHSRNVPAAKMITAIGWELVAKPFLRQLGLSGVNLNTEYGYTLALGAAEVPMLQMANAYSHLSTDTPGVINPILEIRARDGSLLYQRTWMNVQSEIIKPGIRSLIRKILSDSASRIIWWENKFNVAWLSFGLKTWTSDVKTPKGNRPRDGWLCAYTPSRVIMLWMWNTDASAMNVNAFGWALADPFKKFMSALLKNNYITNENMPDKDTVSIKIDKLSGKLATDSTPANLVISTLKYAGAPDPVADDLIQSITYDSSCNGAASPYTAPENTKNGYIIVPNSFIPNGMDLKEITQRWQESSAFIGSGSMGTGWSFSSGKVTYTFNNIFVQTPTQTCDWTAAKPDTNIIVNVSAPSRDSTIGKEFTVSYSVVAPKNIRKVMVLLNSIQLVTFSYPQWNTKSITDTKSVTVTWTGLKNGTYDLDVVAFDFAGFSNKTTIKVTLDVWAITPLVPTPTPANTNTNTAWPKVLENQIGITKNPDGTYAVILTLDDPSGISWGKITRNGTTLYEFKNWPTATFTIDVLGPVVITATDTLGNTLNQTLDLSKYFK